MSIEERIQNKEIEIGKLVNKFDKYSKLVSEEFLALVNQFLRTGDRAPIRQYSERTYNRRYLEGNDYALYETASNLYDARNTLSKYQKQLLAENAKKRTLESMPDVLKQFEYNLIERWDRYDAWKREQIRSEYRAAEKLPHSEYRIAVSEIVRKWGRSYRDWLWISDADIHKQNVKDAENIILNLINRTNELCGQIIDCQYLSLDQDNQGYLIINGLIIGEHGKARVESIGAGGYNIQRYHIRVLVKPVC